MKIIYVILTILALVLFGNLFGIAIWMSFLVVPKVGVFLITVHVVTVLILCSLISTCFDKINEEKFCA